ncbi:hypothetical protein I8752_20200 [Nostocaceae cyanobacterium CENA369]|uniref:Uncharacterized protein n=1 Tax=Dendronalium phyllosphericum CENA369 TaxID=1725256 RepID=A0A8J7LFJ7_9NOST|nr:hypothetical protein [Dendronalium phyllosphericum]MBH8575291.1 hypothetical protein [Dendronalium phyllosphericum CENA369]
MKEQGCFIRSDNDFVKSISQKFEVVGNCKITALTTKFKCDRLVFDPIRLFNDLIFLADTLVNKGLLGNETALHEGERFDNGRIFSHTAHLEKNIPIFSPTRGSHCGGRVSRHIASGIEVCTLSSFSIAASCLLPFFYQKLP